MTFFLIFKITQKSLSSAIHPRNAAAVCATAPPHSPPFPAVSVMQMCSLQEKVQKNLFGLMWEKQTDVCRGFVCARPPIYQIRRTAYSFYQQIEDIFCKVGAFWLVPSASNGCLRVSLWMQDKVRVNWESSFGSWVMCLVDECPHKDGYMSVATLTRPQPAAPRRISTVVMKPPDGVADISADAASQTRANDAIFSPLWPGSCDSLASPCYCRVLLTEAASDPSCGRQATALGLLCAVF